MAASAETKYQHYLGAFGLFFICRLFARFPKNKFGHIFNNPTICVVLFGYSKEIHNLYSRKSTKKFKRFRTRHILHPYNFTKGKQGGSRMNREKLNRMVVAYQQTSDDMVFSEIYRVIMADKPSTIAFAADPAEMQAVYDDCLLKAVNNYDESAGDFSNFLSVVTANGKRDYYRKSNRIAEHETVSLDAEPNAKDAPTLIAPNDTAAEALERKQKADQRQLIDFLTGQTTDSLTKALVRDFAKYPTNDALAKAHGTNRWIIKRRLESLGRHYDDSRFGQYRDYLYA